jgi:geranylgeranyl diphosphate synthase type I
LAFELFHNYTLVHDDIYDEDFKRRGNWSNHTLLQHWFEKKYGKHSSENILFKNKATRFGVVSGIINGKYLHFLSTLPILESNISKEKKMAGMLLHQSVSMIDNTGQAIDLYFEEQSDVKEKDYYDMVSCKTGQLFKSAIEWGAILGNATLSQKKALTRYMEELAIVFQIKDDLLDIDSSEKKGRDIGSDIRKGKKTLLMINTLERADANQRKEILFVFGNKKISAAKIKKIISLMNKLGSIDYCQKKAKLRLQKAIKHLDEASPSLESEAKSFFCDMAHFMLERKK